MNQEDGAGLTCGWNVVHVWFLYHCTHGVLNRAVGELVVGVLLPDLFEVEVGSLHVRFQVLEIPCMRDRFGRIAEMVVEGSSKCVTVCFRITVFGESASFRGCGRSLSSNVAKRWHARGCDFRHV